MKRNEVIGPHLNVYQPGNGMRYEIVCVELNEGLDLFVWINAPDHNRPCTKLAKDGFLAAWWFCDRMGVNHADGAALLAWLRDERGYEVTMPEGYGDDGCWRGIKLPAPSNWETGAEERTP